MSEANAAITSIATTKAMPTAIISDHRDTFKMPVFSMDLFLCMAEQGFSQQKKGL